MKSILYSAFVACALFSGCSKNANYGTPPPVQTAITVNSTSYKTVTVGGLRWTAINYNGPGGENYNNSNDNDTTMGKLYTWDEAKAVILPAGWRLPTEADFTALMTAIGEQQQSDGSYMVIGNQPLQLTSTTRWTTTNGLNLSGFNAFPAGVYNQITTNNQQFNGMGTEAVFLSSTSSTQGGTSPVSFLINPTTAGYSTAIVLPTDRASIRFVTGN